MTAAWGLLVLASWLGWGSLLASGAGLRRGVRIDWGLRAGWGMAGTLAIGGVLEWLHLATWHTLAALVLGGAAVWGLELVTYCRQPAHRAAWTRFWRRPTGWTWALWFLPVAGLAAVAYFGSVRDTRNMNPWDDVQAYLVFVKQLLARGTVIEPFSWRRLSTYGGQQFFMGQVMVVGSVRSGYLVDRGLCGIVLAGLVGGMFRRRGRWMGPLAAALTGLALVVDMPRANTQSLVSGVVLFLALFRTLHLHRRGDRRGIHAAWLAGMVAAGLASLRMNFVPPAGLVIVLAMAGAAWRDRPGWRAYLMRGALALGVMILLILPWALALWESSGSLYYPLMRGYQQPAFDAMLSSSMRLSERAAWVAEVMTDYHFLVLLLPGILVLPRRCWRDGLGLYLAGVIGAAATAAAFTMSNTIALYRYAFPLLLAAWLAAVIPAAQRWRRPWSAALAGVMAVLLLGMSLAPGLARLQRVAGRAAAPVQVGAWSAPPNAAEDYAAAQRMISDEARVLAIVDAPILLDFGRHQIWCADIPGVASPPPGAPLEAGTEAFGAYLRSQGITYVLAVADFDHGRALYDRTYFRNVLERPTTVLADRIHLVTARTNVAFMDGIDALGRDGRTIYCGRYVRVIKVP
jgi:hypothetical protein